MSTLYIAIDESGTFASSDKYFVYGGYSILTESKYQSKLRKYVSVEKNIEAKGEVKASSISNIQKQLLLDVMQNQMSFGYAITNKHLPTICYTSAAGKGIIRDDILKNFIVSICNHNDLKQVSKIHVEIDEQNLSTELKENLYINLYKVYVSGYYNRNQFIKPLGNDGLQISVNYVNSKLHPFVRSADILANTIHHKLEADEDVYSVLKIFKVL